MARASDTSARSIAADGSIHQIAYAQAAAARGALSLALATADGAVVFAAALPRAAARSALAPAAARVARRKVARLAPHAALCVAGLDGDYFNVVGLPVHRLSTTLAELLRSGAVPTSGAGDA